MSKTDTASKVLPSRQYTFNSRTSPLNYSDTTRNTIVCNLGKDAFKVPPDQDCLMSVITAEIQYSTGTPFTFDSVPTFSIFGEGGSGVIQTNQTLNGINTTSNYTVAQLVTALNAKTYTHGANTLTLGVAVTSGAYTLNFSLTGGTGSYVFSFNQMNIPQLGINGSLTGTTPSFVLPFTTPSAPLLLPKYFLVRSPDMQTMYSQAIAKIQNIPPQSGAFIFYQNFSDFDTRVLTPYIQMFQLVLCDEDNNPVNLRGGDWSINIQFKFIPKTNLEFM